MVVMVAQHWMYKARNWTLKNGHSGKSFCCVSFKTNFKDFLLKKRYNRESETQKLPTDF